MIARGRITKPEVAFVCGEALEGPPARMSFGHTGLLMARGLSSLRCKKELSRQAGGRVVDPFTDTPETAQAVLATC